MFKKFFVLTSFFLIIPGFAVENSDCSTSLKGHNSTYRSLSLDVDLDSPDAMSRAQIINSWLVDFLGSPTQLPGSGMVNYFRFDLASQSMKPVAGAGLKKLSNELLGPYSETPDQFLLSDYFESSLLTNASFNPMGSHYFRVSTWKKNEHLPFVEVWSWDDSPTSTEGNLPQLPRKIFSEIQNDDSLEYYPYGLAISFSPVGHFAIPQILGDKEGPNRALISLRIYDSSGNYLRRLQIPSDSYSWDKYYSKLQLLDSETVILWNHSKSRQVFRWKNGEWEAQGDFLKSEKEFDDLTIQAPEQRIFAVDDTDESLQLFKFLSADLAEGPSPSQPFLDSFEQKVTGVYDYSLSPDGRYLFILAQNKEKDSEHAFVHLYDLQSETPLKAVASYPFTLYQATLNRGSSNFDDQEKDYAWSEDSKRLLLVSDHWVDGTLNERKVFLSFDLEAKSLTEYRLNDSESQFSRMLGVSDFGGGDWGVTTEDYLFRLDGIGQPGEH